MTVRATIDELAAWLKAQDEIVLLGHVSPDGDAAGSCLAMGHALRTLNKRVAVCLPGGIPRLYASLPGAETVLEPCAKLPFTPMAAWEMPVRHCLIHARIRLYWTIIPPIWVLGSCLPWMAQRPPPENWPWR